MCEVSRNNFGHALFYVCILPLVCRISVSTWYQAGDVPQAHKVQSYLLSSKRGHFGKRYFQGARLSGGVIVFVVLIVVVPRSPPPRLNSRPPDLYADSAHLFGLVHSVLNTVCETIKGMQLFRFLTDPFGGQAARYRNYRDDAEEPGSLLKRRRLTYERVPGMKGGQTRLNFC